MMVDKLKDNKLFQGIFESAVEGILVVGQQGAIIRANPSIEKMFGYGKGELVHKKVEDLIPKTLRKSHKNHRAKYAKQPKKRVMGKELDLWGLKKDGSQFPLEISLSPTKIEGKPVTIAFARDITDLKKAEKVIKKGEKELRKYAGKLEIKVEERTNDLKDTVQKLVESNLSLEDQVKTTKVAEDRAVASQEMFSAISKNFPQGVIAVINLQFQITHLDGEELTNFGLKGSEFKGVSIDEIKLLSGNQKQQIKKIIGKTLGGNHMTLETRFRKNSYALNTMPLYDSNKQIQYALFVYNNISKQKRIELETLNALAKEKELGELKSRFVDMASHEFRTPLSAILSAAILIGKQNGPGKEEKRERYVGMIRSNVKNLVVILNDFLSLSKLEEGKISVHPENFNLVEFSKSIIKEVNSSRKKGQRIQLINEHPNVSVHLDSKMMHHILVNLLTNAIKYSPENKEVILEISQTDKQTNVMVKDQGIGIPLVEQKYLFQRFYRAKNARNIQGTGLGLHIVKQYSELMGGTVSLKSNPSEGTTFSIELPLNLYEK